MSLPRNMPVNLYPLTFDPIFKERIWGGRALETLYGKKIPAGAVGESWEISDRPGDESVVNNGPLAGRTLQWLMENRRKELLGKAATAASGRFPLLIKILDARETLSLQVHPPAAKAAAMGGEPKTEMWYVARAEPNSELFAGLKRGVTRAQFEDGLARETVAECFHRLPVRAGDAMFLSSGRVHALGAGLVVFEIQQNSDTTYRVFDWNRVDAKGARRELHVPQSLASIDFADFEPGLLAPAGSMPERVLVNDPLFQVSLRRLSAGDSVGLPSGRLSIIGVVEGAAEVRSGAVRAVLPAGGFCLVPAACGPAGVFASEGAAFLQIHAG